MDKQELLAKMRKAISDYKMIESGDRIAVGVSGGKDSMTLLSLLAAFRRFSDVPFDVVALTIDLGFTQDDLFAPIRAYCEGENIPFHVEKTDIGDIVFKERKETNPCSLCAKMRRGALNTTLIKLGCNKLALGHHADDVVDTFLLSLLFEGRLSTFAAKSYMDRTKITLIRPLVYVFERDLVFYAKALPTVKNPCPADKHTQRECMKELIANLQKQYPDIKERIFNAISHPERYNLWDDTEEKYLKEKG